MKLVTENTAIECFTKNNISNYILKRLGVLHVPQGREYQLIIFKWRILKFTFQ